MQTHKNSLKGSSLPPWPFVSLYDQRSSLVTSLFQNLSAKDLDALVDGDERLVAGLVALLAAKDELGVELPVRRDVPLRGDLLVDERVVVLQVGAQALGLEGDPQRVLQHGVGLGRPQGELVGVHGEGGLLLLDRLRVLEEEDLFWGHLSVRGFVRKWEAKG